VNHVALLTPKQYMTTEVHIVSAVETTQQQITIIKCPPMSHSKDQPKGCKNEESANQLAKDTKSIEMENFSASLISAAIKHFEDLKPKAN
jgi:hypothetical protein